MITLTAEETALIEKFLNREITDPIGEDAEMMDNIKDKALALMDELGTNADELNGNLIQWFYDKYKAQQAE
jgi:hypothetical protein